MTELTRHTDDMPISQALVATDKLEGDASWAELKIGVMALQGAVAEHIKMFERLGVGSVVELKTAVDFDGLDGIAIPGGESTAMVLIARPDGSTGGKEVAEVAEKAGTLRKLTEWVKERQMPTWGTCAGLILLSNSLALGTTKQGGQGVIGGLDVVTSRNFFGRQLASFEAQLETPALGGAEPYNGVFIRAPAILEVGEGVEKLCTLEYHRPGQLAPEMVTVGVRQGHLLGCAFHPELTNDPRWHKYFLGMVAEAKTAAASGNF